MNRKRILSLTGAVIFAVVWFPWPAAVQGQKDPGGIPDPFFPPKPVVPFPKFVPPKPALPEPRFDLPKGALNPEFVPPVPILPGEIVLQESDVRRLILEDLQNRVAADRRPYTRYLTLTHLYNADPMSYAKSLEERWWPALSVLLHSLTWNPLPVDHDFIDANKTIMRIYIGASTSDDSAHSLMWGPGLWKQVIAEYPFRLLHADKAALEIAKLTDCELPYVRADWFTFAASRPPLYHDLLELPDTQKQLQERLKVDVAGNIAASIEDPKPDRVARAGFLNSGISFSNRLLERHTIGAYKIRRTEFGTGKPLELPAAFWLSYDFESNAGRRSLFTNPTGPGDGAGEFRHDGGEIIFLLPNGFQAYLLVDKDGERINEAPIKIVKDDRRTNPSVVNGISCMNCHTQGNNALTAKVADELRAHVENVGGFTENERKAVQNLHPKFEEFQRLATADSARVKDMLNHLSSKILNKPPLSLASVTSLADNFQANLTLARAAAEFGVNQKDLEVRLKGGPQPLARLLGPLLLPSGRVPREVFIEAFPLAVREWGHGDSPASKVSPVRRESDPTAPAKGELTPSVR